MNHGKKDRIWTISPASKIEGEAIRQLERAGSLPGMLRAVGLPDLHPGKGHNTNNRVDLMEICVMSPKCQDLQGMV